MISLDTNSYTAFFKKVFQVKQEIDKASIVFISAVSVGELMFGFKKGNREGSNLRDLSDFLDNKKVRLLPITLKTAELYGKVKYKLKRKGTPIPDNDAWIAASALETKSTLVTFDRHFLKVSGLKLWKELKKSAMT